MVIRIAIQIIKKKINNNIFNNIINVKDFKKRYVMS